MADESVVPFSGLALRHAAAAAAVATASSSGSKPAAAAMASPMNILRMTSINSISSDATYTSASTAAADDAAAGAGTDSLKGAAFEEREERAKLFEGWRAASACAVLEVSFGLILVTAAYIHARHPIEWLGALAWHLSLWLLPHLVVHRPRTFFNNLLFASLVGTLALQPHMEVCRRVPYLGATHGAASVMVIIRNIEYYADQESFAGWRRWRRMVFISAWGWHDARDAKYVGPGRWVPEFVSMLKWFTLMVACGLFLFAWGRPAEPPFNALVRGAAHAVWPAAAPAAPAAPAAASASASDMAFFLLVRWSVGFWMLLSWFSVMDTFARSLHLWADGHELRHISEDPWGARTLKDFWGRRWNVPVQDLLVKGVFKPLRRLRWLPGHKLLAKLMVFVVSGACHTYAVSCGGMPWSLLFAMFCFFMCQIPMIWAEDTFNMSGLAWMLGSQIPLAPLFIEPCLSFVHL